MLQQTRSPSLQKQITNEIKYKVHNGRIIQLFWIVLMLYKNIYSYVLYIVFYL